MMEKVPRASSSSILTLMKCRCQRQSHMEAAVVDTSIYRGYFTYLAADASSLNFSARPATPELPILPRVIYRPCASREAALAEAKKRLVLQGF
jgi:hypothetical protein